MFTVAVLHEHGGIAGHVAAAGRDQPTAEAHVADLGPRVGVAGVVAPADPVVVGAGVRGHPDSPDGDVHEHAARPGQQPPQREERRQEDHQREGEDQHDGEDRLEPDPGEQSGTDAATQPHRRGGCLGHHAILTTRAGARAPYAGTVRARRLQRDVLCSTRSPIGCPGSSRTCGARVGCPTPTSTPPHARSVSRCSRPTSRCPWCGTFVTRIKERARGEEVSKALNPAQQVIKIVNEELVQILGGETRRLQFAKQPPTVIMLAGLQGAGKTTLAGQAGALAAVGQGHTAVARRLRPAAPERRQPAPGRRRTRRRRGLRARARQRRRQRADGGRAQRRSGAGRARFDRLRPRRPARHGARRHRRPPRHRRRDDAAGDRHPGRRRPAGSAVRRRRDGRAGRGQHRARPSRTASASPASCSPSSTATPVVAPRCRYVR